MKLTPVLAIVMAGIASPLAAQASESIDYDARVKSVVTLKQHIAQRETRFASLKADLKALDAKLEERVDYLVKTLSDLKDSQDSKTKIASLKEDVIEGLTRSIRIYRQKRMELFDRMRKDQTVSEAELNANIAAFDQRVGKRIEQIMELAKSLPGHRDVPKYETTGTSYSDGWYEETTRISEEYKQNRRQSGKTNVMRRELLEDINKGMEIQENRRRDLVAKLESSKTSAKDRTLSEQELGRVDALLDNLKTRRRELAVPADNAVRELGMSEASDIARMIADAREDLSADFHDFFRKLNDLDKERTRLRELENNLKAREEWLQKNPPPAK